MTMVRKRRRFPSPWTVEELETCFVVTSWGYVYIRALYVECRRTR
jgi:hypothetical protein